MRKGIMAIWMLFLLVSLAGCTSAPEETEPAPAQAVQETCETLQTEPTAQTEQIRTEPETEPSEETEPQQETEPPVVLHSGLREDGSFGEGTLFLGDSLTYMFVGSYLIPNDHMGDASHAAMCGSKVTAFFDDKYRMKPNQNMACSYSEGFEDMAFYEIVADMGEKATAIYMMWGTNYEPNATAQTYIELVDYLLETCPNATVHMQLIPYGNVPYYGVNTMLKEAYGHYQELGETRVFLIDTFTAIDRYPVDGVHQGESGKRKWYNALVEHARENDLPQ